MEVFEIEPLNVPDDLTRPADAHAPDLSGIPVGPYRLIREIGSGGMGTVFLAVRNAMSFSGQLARQSELSECRWRSGPIR